MKKRNIFRSVAAPVLALALFVGAPLPALAQAPNENAVIQPRFSYISRISARLDISAEGYAACSGGYSMFKGMDGTITVTLQQQSTSGRWVDYKEDSKSYTGDGAYIFDTGWDVAKGYSYRVIATVEIEDASGDIVETVTCNSPVDSY